MAYLIGILCIRKGNSFFYQTVTNLLTCAQMLIFTANGDVTMHTHKNGWFWIAMTGAGTYFVAVFYVMIEDIFFCPDNTCIMRMGEKAVGGTTLMIMCGGGLIVFIIASLLSLHTKRDT